MPTLSTFLIGWSETMPRQKVFIKQIRAFVANMHLVGWSETTPWRFSRLVGDRALAI